MALNRQFHFRIFQLSPYNLILDQGERLWDLAAPFIANKLALREARLRTYQEHARLIDALHRRDREARIEVLHERRSSTVSGLPSTSECQALRIGAGQKNCGGSGCGGSPVGEDSAVC